MKKAVDFSTYKHLQKMSFNDMNRWVTSIYKSGYADGYSEFGDNPLVLDEDSLHDLLVSVPGIGNTLANKIVQRFIDETGIHD